MSDPTRAGQILSEQLSDFLRQAPRLIGQESVLFFASNFDKGGFRGRTFQPWKPRKNNEDAGRSILIGKQGGHLRDSIRVVKANRRQVTVGTDVPYARIHNEGGRVSAIQYVRGHHRRTEKGKRVQVRPFSRKLRFKMPQREFIGKSPVLERHLQNQLRHLLRQKMR